MKKRRQSGEICSLGCWCHWILKGFFLSQNNKKRKNTDTWNMLYSAILFCTFPEIQGVGYRKNPVWEGRSAFNVRRLEKPLGGMERKRQGLCCFLSFFLFSPSFQKKVAVAGGWILLGVSQWPLRGRKQWPEDVAKTGKILMHLVPQGHGVIQKMSICCVLVSVFVHQNWNNWWNFN